MNINQLFDKSRTLPVVPRVLQELLISMGNPDQRVDALAQLIATDPAICARLLRLANSARYSAPQAVGSAYQAVQLLGLSNVRSLVISMGLMSSFANLPPEQLQPFWQHSLCTATLARHWAAPAGVDGELAYTLGLLRCVGQLVMRQGMAAALQTLDAQTAPFAPERLAAERAAFGFSYAEVGAQLAQRWQFPVLFAQVMTAADAAVDNPQATKLADLLSLSAWQAWVSDEPLSDEQIDAMWPDALAQRVGVPAQLGGSHFCGRDALCDGLQDLLNSA
jgi:HD-like signal output (HDOD) protein